MYVNRCLPGGRRKPTLDEYLGPRRGSLSLLCSSFPNGWPVVHLWLEALFNKRVHVLLEAVLGAESSYVGDIK